MRNEQEDYRLHLVIGENIPNNAPSEFHMISLYTRDKDNNLKLYADISLPYLINHSKFINTIKDDPRYIFYEAYNEESKRCKYTCMIKPFGVLKGVYRILNSQLIKIQSIDVIPEKKHNKKIYTLTKK